MMSFVRDVGAIHGLPHRSEKDDALEKFQAEEDDYRGGIYATYRRNDFPYRFQHGVCNPVKELNHRVVPLVGYPGQKYPYKEDYFIKAYKSLDWPSCHGAP